MHIELLGWIRPSYRRDPRTVRNEVGTLGLGEELNGGGQQFELVFADHVEGAEALRVFP